MKTSLLIIFAALVIVACTQTQQSTQTPTTQNNPTPTTQPTQAPPTPTQTTTPPTTTPSSQPQAEQDITMDVHEYAFAPSAITVKQGVPVKITITNTGQRTHGFGLPDFNVNQIVDPGMTETFTFTPDKTGTFRFFCSVPCGPGHSDMVGTLIVQ